jgi:hypothetical protein
MEHRAVNRSDASSVGALIVVYLAVKLCSLVGGFRCSRGIQKPLTGVCCVTTHIPTVPTPSAEHSEV